MGKKVYIIALLLISISCMFLFAQRGIKVVVKTSEGSSLALYKQYRALIIGVSDYLYWPRLPNAVKDAREVASVLEEKGFFTVVLENPNSDEIGRRFSNFVLKECGPEDGVLFYFAGHGETMKLADGTELGYIIPQDCPLKSKDPVGFTQKAISMQGIQTYSLQLKSKHLLAIFDSCFSGSIFALGRVAPADITYKTALPVRQYITAGSADEIVPDKSIFKECFLEALKGDADANRDGYVTGSELGMYLESKVVNYTRNSQHPQYGKIRNLKLDKGDFVFALEKVKVGEEGEIQLPATPPKSDLDLSSIKESAEKRAKIKSDWESWQERMQFGFNEVEKIDKSSNYTSEEKKSAWRKFLNTYSPDNYFSSRDEELRQKALIRIRYWEEAFAVTAKIPTLTFKILEKMVEAQGGKKVLEKIKDMTSSGNLELIQMGMTGSMTMYKKEPDKVRMDIEVMGMIITQAFDGETAWWVNPQTGSREEMPEQQAEDMKRMALGIDAFIYPEKYGIAFAYKGKEKIEEKEYLVLEQTFSDGHKATLYIDPKTYLTYKSKSTTVNQMGTEVEQETFESDFQKVNGMTIAYSIIIFQDGEEFMKVKIKKVKLNSRLKDALFKMH